ncbi:hypothetical protein DW095_00990 [Bacteroides sp. AM07-16]|nr:hypothetical protein DW095_00990 [Bacteroides sp. AM07-16]
MFSYYYFFLIVIYSVFLYCKYTTRINRCQTDNFYITIDTLYQSMESCFQKEHVNISGIIFIFVQLGFIIQYMINIYEYTTT